MKQVEAEKETVLGIGIGRRRNCEGGNVEVKEEQTMHEDMKMRNGTRNKRE